MLSNLWRLLLALFDLRAWARLLTGRPPLDVVFITNLRDEAERRRFFGGWAPPEGHANGPRIHLNGVAGRVRGIYVTAEEMMSREGRRLAKQQFIAATAWADKQGARVVLLAASTKRLFGRDGAELKARFPHILFTIGDNGTAEMLRADLFRALADAGLRPDSARVLVIGPYGILGRCMTGELLDAGYEVAGFGANASALREIAGEFRIPTHTRIEDIGKVDAVVACTHSTGAKLDIQGVNLLQRPGRRLLVVDVAEPANLDRAVYEQLRAQVVRQDAGNAFARRLHYVLGPLSWRKLMLSRGTVFGCFAESMALFYAIHRMGHAYLAGQDWFRVDQENRALVQGAFTEIGFTVPSPRCFGEAVRGFDLALPHSVQNTFAISTPKVLPRPLLERMVSR